MTLQEQIAKIKETIKDTEKKISGVMEKCLKDGKTPEGDDEATIKGYETDLENLNLNLKRLENILKSQADWENNTTPVQGQNAQQAKDTAEGKTKTNVEVKSNLPKGIGFAQYARAKLCAQLSAKEGNYVTPLDIAKAMGFNDEVQQLIEKATLGTTTNAGFAATLVTENRLVGEFIELLQAATIFDKLKGYRPVPFNSKIPSQLTGGTAAWVGEGAAKPLTNPTFGEVEIKEHKLAAITVYTQELVRRSDPAVDALVRDDLIAASARLIDTTFIGAQAASATTPVGILNGVTAITPTGETPAQIEADLLSLINVFVQNNLSLDGAYFLMSETRAAKISLLRDALGNTYFNGMTLRGDRTILGVPVITSESVGNKIILVKMSEILVAQDGGVDISYSDQATLVDGSVTHNLWQENKFAVRVEKFITWAKRRPVAAAWIDYD
ncbi:phage major capsid protein [Acinetobacter ursingii]|nr:phage major capsid protein [Acinetobacter ursingii]MCU4496358.1 phage major capsid protein [Acinetobacter ursingii]